MLFSKLESNAKLPTRKNPTDAGLDLYAYVPYDIKLSPGDVYICRTGIVASIPTGMFGWITNKSRNNFLIGGGIIDEGYQGELLVKIMNVTNEDLYVKNEQAIAQLLILTCQRLPVEEVPAKEIFSEKTARGITGGIVTQWEADVRS